MQTLNKAYLLIGSNEGDRILALQKAIDYIGKDCGKIITQSAMYETEAWGYTQQPEFLNQALELETHYSPQHLMPALLEIEEKMGRKRSVKYGPRMIDIDILLFNDEIINEPALVIPHPEMANRLFALVPLEEIAAEVIHPVLKKTIRTMVKECKDFLKVQKINV